MSELVQNANGEGKCQHFDTHGNVSEKVEINSTENISGPLCYLPGASTTDSKWYFAKLNSGHYKITTENTIFTL